MSSGRGSTSRSSGGWVRSGHWYSWCPSVALGFGQKSQVGVARYPAAHFLEGGQHPDPNSSRA
eukprot:5991808-Pyramimonas_sp.AAC.1